MRLEAKQQNCRESKPIVNQSQHKKRNVQPALQLKCHLANQKKSKGADHNSDSYMENDSDDAEYMVPNDIAYTRWSCHSALASHVQILSTPPAPSKGSPITFFGQADHAKPLDGWKCSS